MFILLNVLCIIIMFFIGADIFSLADELSYCKTNDIDILKRKYSTCRECGHRLRVKDTFPIVSRFINKGKCRFCDAPFSKRGFYTEALGGLLAIVIYVLLYYVDKLSIFAAAFVTIIISIICMIIISIIYTRLKVNKSDNIPDEIIKKTKKTKKKKSDKKDSKKEDSDKKDIDNEDKKESDIKDKKESDLKDKKEKSDKKDIKKIKEKNKKDKKVKKEDEED